MDAAAKRPGSSTLTKDIEYIHHFTADRMLISAHEPEDAESLARHLHRGPKWPRGPFAAVDCGAPADVLDGEVFARLTRRTDAPVWTLFLKEVGRLPRKEQDRLLSLLTDAAMEAWPRAMQARVIASTSESLFDRVCEGTFDASLFYRLNVIHLDLRPD